MMKRKLLCVGYGEVAKNIDRSLDKKNWSVIGTSRSMREGLIQYNVGQNIIDMQGVTHILVSIPPDHEGDGFLRDHMKYLQDLETLEHICYLSSTGVYGDHKGEWVDESSVLLADDMLGVSRIKAEQDWLNSDFPVNVLRLGGIYGDNRNMVRRMMNGDRQCIVKKGSVFNRIHVKDIANIFKTLLNHYHSNNKEIYNCVDDVPSENCDVMRYVGSILDMDIIYRDYYSIDKNEFMTHFFSNSKRVKNEKIKRELGVELFYPDYMAGLDYYLNRAYVSIK